MDREALKRQVASASLALVEPGCVLGVGTGSTVGHLIDGLASHGPALSAAVASSRGHRPASGSRVGIEVVDLADVGRIDVYVDGADEVDAELRLIKGGGGALTREKICAQAAERFVCIVDESKLVSRLGAFPLPVEVIPMAAPSRVRPCCRGGGRPRVREGFATDNGNLILDVSGLDLTDPAAVELALDSYPGVVTSGLFARRRADVVLVAGADGVRQLSTSYSTRCTPSL